MPNMSTEHGAIYKIRWEIALIAISLILSAVAVLAIPNDYTTKMLKDQKEQKIAEMEKEKEMEKAREEAEKAAHAEEHKT